MTTKQLILFQEMNFRSKLSYMSRKFNFGLENYPKCTVRENLKKFLKIPGLYFRILSGSVELRFLGTHMGFILITNIPNRLEIDPKADNDIIRSIAQW